MKIYMDVLVLTSGRVGQSVSLGKTVDCIVISEGGPKPHNYSIYYLSLKDRNFVRERNPVLSGLVL